MPYIGNQHNVGDHVNNFKVLDDISSYTATFNGSATSVVSTSNDTIRIPVHRFIQGQRVTYNNGGGSNIGGLTSGTAYYVSFDSSNTIKLATSLSNANSNTVINLSSVGGGTSHTLNAAFDGINTKFKVTFASGKAARFNNATQLNVAINNVIQRPNLSAASFTEGFAIEDSHKIVFKDAPTASDIFWGSIIANTIENFDLRDNEIDNFTGNGSTTEFTLSTVPANNESVIVTIDGVLQHPSDSVTTRAYTLIDSIIQFSSAPALNAEIQVRHIGFAGATTNDVSGFYGRTGNVALTANDHITTGDLTSRNVNISGILTASSASFGGNVSIGGTLTYEDVTNIDSVGVITARNGIDCTDNINIDADNKKLLIGDGQDLQLYHNGNTSNITNYTGILNITGVVGQKIDIRDGSAYYIRCNSTNSVELFYNGGSKFSTKDYGATLNGELRLTTGGNGYTFIGDPDTGMHNPSDGNLNFKVNGANRLTINSSGNVSIAKDLDVDGHTNLDNVNIAGVTTSTGNIYADNYFANSGLTLNNNGNPSVNITSTSTTGSSRIHFGDPDSGVVGKIYYVHNGDYMQFNTAYAERLRISSAGLIETKTRSAAVRRMILAGSPSNGSFNIEAHDGSQGIAAGTVQGELGLYYNDGTTLSDTATIKFERGSGAPDGAMAFFTNNSERFRIHSGGLVEALSSFSDTYSTTTSINPHLRVRNQQGADNIYGGIQLRADRGTGAAAIFNIACLNSSTNYASTLVFQSRNTDGNFSEKLRISSTGQVLIGGTSDAGHSSADDLTIYNSGHGGITIRTGTTSNGAIFFADSTSGDARFDGFVQYNHGSSPYMLFGTAGDERLRIASNGNVSIGTQNVGEGKLQVNGDITAKQRHGSSDMYGMLAGRKFDGTSAMGGYAIRYASGYESPWIVGYNAGSSYDNQITFGSMTTSDRSLATGVQKRMVIDMASGNVGIGTDDPDELLELSGVDPVLKLHDSAGGSTHGLKVNHDGVNATINLESAGLLSIKLTNDNAAGNGIKFNTGTVDTEKLRITVDGHIGIGTNTPGEKLDVNGAIRLRGNDQTTYAAVLKANYNSTHVLSLESYHNSGTAFEVIGTHADGRGANVRVAIAKDGQIGWYRN